MERIVVFHCNAMNIYYIVDGDICTSTIKIELLLRFHNNCYVNAPQVYILHCLSSYFILRRPNSICISFMQLI